MKAKQWGKEARGRNGRPSLPIATKKAKLCVSLSPPTIEIIDGLRGEMPRSRFIDAIVGATRKGPDLDKRIAQKRDGAFYTPRFLSSYIAKKTCDYVFEDANGAQAHNRRSRSNTINILDPACGDGELLLAIVNCIAMENRDETLAIYGIDKDSRATRIAENRLAADVCGSGLVKTFSFDSILKLHGDSWRDSLGGSANNPSLSDGFDVVIANPPWGADIKKHKAVLTKEDYTLLGGQVDSADLFLELALNIVRPDGVLAFIVPDSLFSHERRKVRELLCTKTTLLFVARLGEKIFDGINRACAIVIARKSPPVPGHKTQVLRLNNEMRSNILTGSFNLDTAEKRYSHHIMQSRFASDVNFKFDIDLAEPEELITRKMKSSGQAIGNICSSNRGIELSKSGKVIQCRCGTHCPVPKGTVTCKECSREISRATSNVCSIVSKSKAAGYVKLLAGESVSRYKIDSPLWVDITAKGINYKDNSLYSGDKIVIRKTGVGISATIDYSGATTTQVVYILKRTQNAVGSISIEALLGILNSRAMYYYLVKAYGETEWRSHPYLTQSQILELPIPLPTEENMSMLHEIEKLVGATCKENDGVSEQHDAMIEKFVASLYGLTPKDYEYVYETIDTVQDLLPVRALKHISLTDIFGRI